MSKGKGRRPKKTRLRVSAFRDARWCWPILIASVAVPVIVTVFFWHHAGFETPMPREVFDKFTGHPLVFPMFVGLVAAASLIRYYSFPVETRNRETIRRTPILIFMGLGVAAVTAGLLWWQDPGFSARTMISEIVSRPFVIGSIIGLAVGGVSLIFLLSPKEDQTRSVRVALTMLAAFLAFGGPTYLVYVLQRTGAPYYLIAPIGLASFVAGVILLVRQIGEERKD